ncbi:hypothetical protein [Vreelandella janggokensis]|uniref:hypothetical protein n=1 Tax=Vreelandella janggokensis TaxID=370767 RepID=UPI00286217B9|nr:hypothetical protein [Halomonas janggokensis]MDR5886623.1 hypothetical protein [Halomonas janggokensis]
MSQLEKINDIENVLVRLIKCEHYFELCTGYEGDFWPVVQNAVGEAACLFWCHLFGNWKDDLHFCQFFKDSSENDFSPKSVKQRMLSAMNLSEPEYRRFWREVKDCRDKFVSHKEHGASVIFPHIELCRIQAEELRRILSDYSKMKNKAELGSGWEFWVEYYSGQWLKSGQFSAECQREFSKGVVGAAKELTIAGRATV